MCVRVFKNLVWLSAIRYTAWFTGIQKHGPCLKGPPLSTYPGIINNYSGYPSHQRGMIKNHVEFKKKIEIIPPMKEVPWRVKEWRDQMITHYHTASTFQASCLFFVVKCNSLIVTMFSRLISTWRSWFLVLVSCLHCRYANEARTRSVHYTAFTLGSQD